MLLPAFSSSKYPSIQDLTHLEETTKALSFQFRSLRALHCWGTQHPRDAGGCTVTPSLSSSANSQAQWEAGVLCELLLPKQPPTAPTAWPCLKSAKNLWGREEQSTVVPTHSTIIILCFTSRIIYLDTQCHAACCDHRELAVPLLENFPFSLPKYFN